MTDILASAAISSLLTALMGFIAFLLSQVYFKSIERYKELKAKTAFDLAYYANLFCNPIKNEGKCNEEKNKKYEHASDELRKLSSEWVAYIQIKAWPGFFVKSDVDIIEVSQLLAGISNSMHYEEGLSNHMENYKAAGSIRMILGIKQLN